MQIPVRQQVRNISRDPKRERTDFDSSVGSLFLFVICYFSMKKSAFGWTTSEIYTIICILNSFGAEHSLSDPPCAVDFSADIKANSCGLRNC